jgi:hypothetical protein
MAKRHGTWAFTGERNAAGKPQRYFTGIPARDLTDRDIDRLDDDQYATVVASDLYEKTEPPKADSKGKGDDAPAKTDATSGKDT